MVEYNKLEERCNLELVLIYEEGANPPQGEDNILSFFTKYLDTHGYDRATVSQFTPCREEMAITIRFNRTEQPLEEIKRLVEMSSRIDSYRRSHILSESVFEHTHIIK